MECKSCHQEVGTLIEGECISCRSKTGICEGCGKETTIHKFSNVEGTGYIWHCDECNKKEIAKLREERGKKNPYLCAECNKTKVNGFYDPVDRQWICYDCFDKVQKLSDTG